MEELVVKGQLYLIADDLDGDFLCREAALDIRRLESLCKAWADFDEYCFAHNII